MGETSFCSWVSKVHGLFPSVFLVCFFFFSFFLGCNVYVKSFYFGISKETKSPFWKVSCATQNASFVLINKTWGNSEAILYESQQIHPVKYIPTIFTERLCCMVSVLPSIPTAYPPWPRTWLIKCWLQLPLLSCHQGHLALQNLPPSSKAVPSAPAGL